MLGLSWSEIAVVLVVAILVVDPKDIPSIVRSVRQFMHKLKELQHEITSTLQETVKDMDITTDLKEEVNAINKDIEYIVDMEGNLQETYDISDLDPDLHNKPAPRP